MKTIIKYELVINEALRSALNYNTPDEQINEFIRFFGRHIGSDRIYIFEDCKERHGTDNTYEWCAQGVTPEIDRLQNVDMDVIKWWYDTFSRGESIIITDIEDIKEEHRVSYDMLKAQNVRNVVVCPLRYKDEISGFFGVDNPPKSDYRGLTTFLDMIGTLLISFLKLRNSFIKSNKEAKLSSYSSLSKIYISMHLVDVQTKRYHIIKMTDQIAEYLGKDFKMGEYEIRDDFCGHIKNIAEKMCTESQLQESLEFVDISTLEERLLGENSITHEFTDKISGWNRSRFIPVDYDEDGKLLHVLFCIECIEEEKKRENRLIYLAQTDLMTGLCNRGSGEKKITEFLKEKGLTDKEININAPVIVDMKAERYGNNQDSPYRYNVTTVITVTSNKVDLLRGLITEQGELLKRGIAITTGDYQYNIQYEYTGLNTIKPQMIEEATKNARQAAEKFAKDSESTLGKIRHANQGQFSISDRDPNTPHIKKVRVVTTIDYSLEDLSLIHI